MAEKAFVATIYGRVQGVGFRYFTQNRATALGLVGYVRNRWDGTVEVLAEGEEERLRRLLSQLQVGPRSAQVEKVEVRWQELSGKYMAFRMRP